MRWPRRKPHWRALFLQHLAGRSSRVDWRLRPQLNLQLAEVALRRRR